MTGIVSYQIRSGYFFDQANCEQILFFKMIFSRLQSFMKVVFLYVYMTWFFKSLDFDIGSSRYSYLNVQSCFVFYQVNCGQILFFKKIFSLFGSFMKVVSLYMHMTLDFLIVWFQYQKLLIFSFEFPVLLGFWPSKLQANYVLQSDFSCFGSFMKVVSL